MARMDNIRAANPGAQANKGFIDALFLELHGRPATPGEVEHFSQQSVKDASNNVLGSGRSPFYQEDTSALTDAYGKKDPFHDFNWDEDTQRDVAEKEYQDWFLDQKGELTGRLDTEKSRIEQDWETLLSGFGDEKTYASQDLSTILEQAGIGRQHTTQDYGQQLTQGLGNQVADAGNRGLYGNFGGFEANKDYITQQNQQGMSRALEQYGLQEESAQTAYERALADIQKRQKTGKQTYKRGLYDIGEERRLGLVDLRDERDTGVTDQLTEERRASRNLYEERRDDYYNYQ